MLSWVDSILTLSVYNGFFSSVNTLLSTVDNNLVSKQQLTFLNISYFVLEFFSLDNILLSSEDSIFYLQQAAWDICSIRHTKNYHFFFSTVMVLWYPLNIDILFFLFIFWFLHYTEHFAFFRRQLMLSSVDSILLSSEDSILLSSVNNVLFSSIGSMFLSLADNTIF